MLQSELPYTTCDRNVWLPSTALTSSLMVIVREITDLSYMQSYARKISQCLTQIAQQNGSTSDLMKELHTWTSEVSAMLVFLAVGNLQNYLTFTSSRLDGNIGPSVSQLPDTFYHDFVVSSRAVLPYCKVHLC